jgi:two-component system, NarL family, response regulator NreC
MIKLLVADDHTVLRHALCEMLEKRGNYKIIAQASDGQEMLELLHSGTVAPDLILMDVAMPRLSGLQALEQMAKESIPVPVLILSADDGEKNVRMVLKAGARGFMPKNSGMHELEFAIHAVLQGKTYLSPSITAQLMSEPDSSTAAAPNPLAVLTQREIEIFKHLADGKNNRSIGKLLHISTRTVDTHRANILKKLNLRTNAELVKLAIGHGIISV